MTLTKERLSDLEHEAIFPIVVVHNPYQWLASMCKESYFATWNRTHKQCPLLAPSPQDMANGYSGIYHCPKSTQDLGERFHSLHHYWSNFYQQCWYDSKPCVLVRYEDLVFHAEKVIRQIADCAGLLMNPRGFYYMNQASKIHGKLSDFSTVLTKYGQEQGRQNGLMAADLGYAQEFLIPCLTKYERE